MNFLDKVKNENEIVYTILKHSFENKKISHAYLFSGPSNQDIINEPNMLIELLINESPFESVQRTLNTYSDISILDGSEGLIKKDAVIKASEKLQEKALDELGVKILFIKNIENTNLQSINSLLKFIEEPTENTFIIMTTNNISNVLPTIRSRSQVINIKKTNKSEITTRLINEGVDENIAGLLTQISDSFEEAKNLSENEVFKTGFAKLIEILKQSIKNKSDIIIGLKTLIAKSNYKVILAALKEFINNVWKYNSGATTTLFGYDELFKEYKNFDFKTAIPAIEDFIVSQDSNVNFDLYKIKMLIKLEGCYE